MNYSECLQYLKNEQQRGSIYGLDAINLLLDKLNRPENSFKTLHIAGTNGKGSVSAYLTNIIATTYNVGTFNSPAVFCYNETFLINGKAVDDETIAKNMSIVIDEVEKIKKTNSSLIPTAFEIEFATALLIFKHQHVDFAIIECGLGGRMDATNALSSKLFGIITSISLDHTAILGNTLEAITNEKLAISPNYIVSYRQQTEVMKVLKSAKKLYLAKEPLLQIANSSGQTFNYKFDSYKIQLQGKHQLINASIALCAVDALKRFGYWIKKANIKKGLLTTKLPGRCEKMHLNNKIIILDGAHNPDGALALKNFLDTNYANLSKAFVFGCFKDKDYDKILDIIKSPASMYVATAPTDRGLDLLTLKNICEKHFNNVITNTSISEAVKNALNEQVDMIVIFGSLSILKDAKDYIRGIIDGQNKN